MENYFRKGAIQTFVDAGKLSTNFVFSFSNESSETQITKEEAKTKKENPTKFQKNTKDFVQEKVINPNLNVQFSKSLQEMESIKLQTKATILKSNRINYQRLDTINTKLTVSPLKKLNSNDENFNGNIVTNLELEFRTVVT
jgi:hypothetical protein